MDVQALDAVDDFLQAVSAEGELPGVGKLKQQAKAPGGDLQRGTSSSFPMCPIYRYIILYYNYITHDIIPPVSE